VTREHWGWAIWGGGWLALGFCVLESLAVWWPACPWPTFSSTAWGVQQRWPWITVPVVAVLAILAAHLVRLKGIEEGDPQLAADVKAKKKEKP
jgi:hypothetical protein